jgi:2OG-Fe(II) oxygenase superfamily
MATAARVRLARMLRGGTESASSVGLTASVGDLNLEVDGFGSVRFPVTPAKARKLIGLGRPARFGRGEQTLTDPDVRDTWEVPRHLVRAEWDERVLADILVTIKEELGLPGSARLAADLHSLLVYESGQFFLAHQDSEKDDSMVATLVVTLPSSYRGGELVVEHNGERTTYQGSRTALSLAAFYADCRHEVLPVASGYRITLTYNLLLHGDVSRADGDEGTVRDLTDLLREHFSTPVPRYYGRPATSPPNRLAYLLDHEYTPRSLTWSRLKGDDTSRVSLLREAADRAGCETVLALADIKTTHSAYEDDDSRYRYRRWDDYEDEDDDADGSGDAGYEIQELIQSEAVLTHWAGLDGTGLEQTSLSLHDAEVCASTPDGDLTPYQSEYEGYMGNWGNTLDRWYHRAAVVMWPREQAFANRAETSPAWALREITAMDAVSAQAAAITLAPFWDATVRGQAQGLFSKALRAAKAVTDADTAAMLLGPFRIENLTRTTAATFGKLAASYGDQWAADQLRAWSGGDQPAWAYGAGRDRRQWAADVLPGACAALHASGTVGMIAAQWLLDLTWDRIRKEISSALASSSPSHRDKELGELGKPLASLLTAAAATGAESTRDTITGYLRQQTDAVTALQMSALRTAAELSLDSTHRDAGFEHLAAESAARLRTRLARPQRAPGDWSAALPAGCACDLCGALRGFLEDPGRQTLEWPLAQQGRHHIHSRIDAAELPVTHVTRRQGRPYTLVLTKTTELFTREQQARVGDQADLQWLTDRRNASA